MDAPQVWSILQAHLQRAEAELVRQMGESSACQLHKEGRMTYPLKRAEGALVALNDARRALSAAMQRESSLSPEMAQAVFLSQLARWREALDIHRARHDPAPSWLAYHEGGVAALMELSQALAGAEPAPAETTAQQSSFALQE